MGIPWLPQVKEKIRKMKFLQDLGKSGNFTLIQGKFTYLKEVKRSEISSRQEVAYSSSPEPFPGETW